jgi:hypothetical protein
MARMRFEKPADDLFVASAILAGAHEVVSFDERLKTLARAAGLNVFPALEAEGLKFLARLKRA